MLLFCFFFFKQKTAYEMRISDWSSDVCSSDLLALMAAQGLQFITTGQTALRELRSFGKENIWLCHMGQALLDGSFEDFQRKVVAMEVASDGLWLRMNSLRGDQLIFGWKGPLIVNGLEQPLSGFRDRKSTRLNSSH